jgi:hypothetical protein
MSTSIFDRTEIVQLLKDTCLAEGGTSSAITCTQKTGKSYLLRHVYDSSLAEFNASKKVIFCSLSMDWLQSIIQTQGGSHDQAFYHFFCQKLQDQIEPWAEDLGRDETERKAQIQQLVQKSVTASPQVKAAMNLNRQSLELQQSELDRLRVILKLLDPLVQANAQVDIPELAKVLDKLKRVDKRVILFIDDFDRILRSSEVGLSNAVLNFLRGASTEKKLITFVTSNLHPMSPELHDTDERPALVNHFQVQHLAPFNRQQAADFLSWLSQAKKRPSLDQKQVDYLVDLGGGCPYFLDLIYGAFEFQDRPPESKWKEFESRDLIPLVEPVFRELLQRCSDAQKTMLREVAAENAIATASRTALELEREGYLIINGGNARLFSRLFTSFIKNAPGNPPPMPTVKETLNYQVFPTSLAKAQPAENHALLSFIVDNPTKNDISVLLTCELLSLSYEARELRKVARRKSEIVEMKVTLKDPFPIVLDPRWGNLRYSATYQLENGNTILLRVTDVAIQILPIDTFVFARQDITRHKVKNWSWMIAAWVSKNQETLQPVILQAQNIYGGGMRGYGVAGDVSTGVRAQVKALYEALQQIAKITYDDSGTVFHLDETAYAQRVRLPSRTLQDKRANCLDGSVLFASLLANLGLHPVILLLPRHAIVGWKQEDSQVSDLEFLETTLIEKNSFEDARREGMALYGKTKALAAQQVTDEIPNLREFAIMIDVEKEWSERHVLPLPWT